MPTHTSSLSATTPQTKTSHPAPTKPLKSLALGKHQLAEPGAPECVERYNVSLSTYLEAINNGNLDADLLARLISDLDAVKEKSDSGTIALEFSVDEVGALVNLVADYTYKLAEANSVELSPLNETRSNSGVSAVSDLRRYLEMQRPIFNQAA